MHYHSILLIFLTLCCGVSLLQGCTANQDPKVVFPKREHNFPEPFIVGSEIVTIFSFTNEGKAPLHIQKIDSDCGCVATNVSSDKIAPSEKGEIRVVVERDAGGFRQNVFVYTDDPAMPMVRLQVSGVILPPVSYPKKIELGQLEKGKRVSKKIKFTNNLKSVVEISEQTVSDKNISITLPKKSIPAGESMECESVLTVNDVGLYSESLTITVRAQEVFPGTDSKELEISVQFQGRVLGGIVVLPQNLFLGVLDGSGKSFQKKFQIKTDGSRPFGLKSISADNFSVAASLSKEALTAHEVDLTITPNIGIKSSGLVEGTIQIFTTHPDVPKITIPVKAVTP